MNDPLWYKDAIIYELHVRTFFDADDDGMGDFKGLTEQLDYLKDLGVTALWVLPFYPSPWHDDGYDIADYSDVHPAYGTLDDFKRFLDEAHARDLRVITELVINHTSDQHPWFQRARRAPKGSPERDYYVWSDTPEKYEDARIIFKDFEPSNWSWDPVAEQYYWHRFYSQQPDLNFDNPAVHQEIFDMMDFWFEMGVDGMRLDAIPYLYEREGTNCENLPETHDFLKKLRAHVDSKFDDRMFLAEANQWPEDAAEYFGDGDECHMNFHFPVMPRLFMSVQMEDRFPIIDILEQTPEIPDTCQWATFLRNHDELTLEMVTDEERDYMYRSYAHEMRARINLGIRRRLAPLLGNNRRKIELLNGLLFSLPGTPVLYYGDEIGMGDNIYLGDRNGVRTPMQWSGDRNAGFSDANPQKLYLPVVSDPEFRYEGVNVRSQQDNPSSLLWWMKRIMALRKRYRAFGRGSIEFLSPHNRKVLVFLRKFEDEHILVVANLSRFVQAVELDLAEYDGCTPVELFGRTPFPRVGELPYFLTLGPHSFYWFSLEPARAEGEAPEAGAVRRRIEVGDDWTAVVSGPGVRRLERVLPDYLRSRRWYGGKARRIRHVEVATATALTGGPIDARLLFVRVAYGEGDPETYFVPVARAYGEKADRIRHDWPQSVIAELGGDDEAILYDALVDDAFAGALLRMILDGDTAGEGRLVGRRAAAASESAAEDELRPSIIRGEQSNSSIIFGDRYILKVFRKIEPGTNPDLEITGMLTERAFPHIARVAGSLEYRPGNVEPAALGILQDYVENEGDAWVYTQDALGRYFEAALSEQEPPEPRALDAAALIERAGQAPPQLAEQLIGSYLETARLLGQRTAELHTALADSADGDFRPEPFSTLYQRSLYQSMRSTVREVFHLLASREGEADPALEEIAGSRDAILQRMRTIVGTKIDAARTRTHGDYHLGQVLFTGKDFVIVDFEGEPARPLSARRIKRSPLRDVAGMLRSFHYAAWSVALGRAAESPIREQDTDVTAPWADFWYGWVAAAFLEGYLDTAGNAEFLPGSASHLATLLDAFLLEKAVYELGYELNNRPDWVAIPVRGIMQLLGS